MSDPSFPPGRDRSLPRRFTAYAGIHLVAFALAASRMSAQPSRPAFDYRSELNPGHESTVIARGDFNGDGVPDLVVAGPGHMTVFTQGATSFEWKATVANAADPAPVAALTGRLNGDSRDDLVLLYGPRPSVAAVYITDQRNIPVLSSTIELTGDYHQALVADPDADRAMDLLFFGKKTQGIAVYTGNGKGAFTTGPVLFPELSVSQAAVALMDGDNIPDVVAVDWLGNKVLVFPGFGGFNYGDPAVVPFEEEPVSAAVGDINGDRIRDIVAGFAEPPGFLVLQGDGLGNYLVSGREPLDSPPEKIRVGDIDGDSRNDLLMFLPAAQSLTIRLQEAGGGFSFRQTYSAGSAPSDIVFFQDARRRVLNASVLSAGGDVVRLLHTRSAEAPETGIWTLATGVAPGELEIADLNGDGWPDVALTQGAESVLSLFLNDGRGVLGGQMTLPIPFASAGLTAIASPPGENDFLASGQAGGTISYLVLDAASLTVAPMTLQSDGGLVALDGHRLPEDSMRRVFAMREDSGGTEPAVYSYDLADTARFGESETPLDIPGRIAAVSVCKIDADARRDLAVLSVTGDGSRATVTFFRQTDEGFVRSRAVPFPLPDTAAASGVGFWVTDLDGEGAEDIVLNFGKPANTLAVSLASGDTAFGAPVVIQTDVRIPGRKSLAVTDFDADGKPDLVFVNERTRTVQFLPGNGKGRYEGPVNLTSTRGVRGFGVGDINRDNEKELVLSNSDLGVLTVTSFHHPLFVRRRGRGGE